MSKRLKHYGLNEPLFHADHHRPRTRRDFIAQGFRAGVGTMVGASIFSLFANPRSAFAELAPDVSQLRDSVCGIATHTCVVGLMRDCTECIDVHLNRL